MRKLLRGTRGFTLIELLIVLAILGVVTAIVVPNVVSYMGVSSVKAANLEVEAVETAAMTYWVENDEYATSSDDVLDYLVRDLRAEYTITGIEVTDATLVGVDNPWEHIKWDGVNDTWVRES